MSAPSETRCARLVRGSAASSPAIAILRTVRLAIESRTDQVARASSARNPSAHPARTMREGIDCEILAASWSGMQHDRQRRAVTAFLAAQLGEHLARQREPAQLLEVLRHRLLDE